MPDSSNRHPHIRKGHREADTIHYSCSPIVWQHCGTINPGSVYTAQAERLFKNEDRLMPNFCTSNITSAGKNAFFWSSHLLQQAYNKNIMAACLPRYCQPSESLIKEAEENKGSGPPAITISGWRRKKKNCSAQPRTLTHVPHITSTHKMLSKPMLPKTLLVL